MTVAHQDLSQLTPRMLGALSNVQTKVIFGIGRYDAEYFAKLIGYVDTEAIKRDAKTETQHEMFSSLPEQWERWVDRLRYQPARQATVARRDGAVVAMRTLTVPRYTATDTQVEAVKRESMARFGVPYAQARRNVETAQVNGLASSPSQQGRTGPDIPAYELVSA